MRKSMQEFTNVPELKADDFTRINTLFVPETVASMASSPDGKYLVIAAGDKLHVHGLPSVLSASTSAGDFPRLVSLYMPDKVQSVVFSQDGTVLFVAIADKVHLYRMPL